MKDRRGVEHGGRNRSKRGVRREGYYVWKRRPMSTKRDAGFYRSSPHSSCSFVYISCELLPFRVQFFVRTSIHCKICVNFSSDCRREQNFVG